jgi:hypothetical protein
MILQPVIDYELSMDYPSTWASMEKLVDKGKAKLIGKKSARDNVHELHGSH